MIALLERRWVRYPLFLFIGVLTFFIALIWAFPDEEIRDIIEVQAEKALKHQYDVSIADVDLYWLTGLELHNVKITKLSDLDLTDDAAAPDVIPMKVEIPEIAARLAVFRSLVNLAPAVQFKVDLGGGVVGGAAIAKNKKIRVDAKIGPVDLRQTPAFTALLGIPFFGELSGDLDMTFDQVRRIPVEGGATLKGDKITFGPATVKTDKLPAMAFIEVPQTNLGTLDVLVDVEKLQGRPLPETVIKKFTFGGRDLRGDLWGNVTPVSDGRKLSLNLKMRVQFDTQFVTKNSLGPLLNIQKVRLGKNKDWYGFSITGQPPKVHFNGAPDVVSGPKASKDDSPSQSPEGEGGAPAGNDAPPATE